MRTLQTILLEQAPSSDSSAWDLLKLKRQIIADESCAHTAGENLGTKLIAKAEPQALIVHSGGGRSQKSCKSAGLAVMLSLANEKLYI